MIPQYTVQPPVMDRQRSTPFQCHDDRRRSGDMVNRPNDRNVCLETIYGKQVEFDNWFHQCSLMARAYQWDPREKMVRLMSCLRGPALTAHRSLPHGERDNYDSCIDLLRKSYGHDRPIAKTTLRADLSAISQEEGESLDTFADRVYALTVEAYPNMERGNLLDSLAVPALRKGIRDRSAAQEALKFSNPSTTRAAVETVLHIQSAARTRGVRDRCPVCRSDPWSTRQVSSVSLGPLEYAACLPDRLFSNTSPLPSRLRHSRKLP